MCDMLSNICSDDKFSAHVREECVLHAEHIVTKLPVSSGMTVIYTCDVSKENVAN